MEPFVSSVTVARTSSDPTLMLYAKCFAVIGGIVGVMGCVGLIGCGVVGIGVIADALLADVETHVVSGEFRRVGDKAFFARGFVVLVDIEYQRALIDNRAVVHENGRFFRLCLLFGVPDIDDRDVLLHSGIIGVKAVALEGVGLSHGERQAAAEIAGGHGAVGLAVQDGADSVILPHDAGAAVGDDDGADQAGRRRSVAHADGSPVVGGGQILP